MIIQETTLQSEESLSSCTYIQLVTDGLLRPEKDKSIVH